MVRSEIRSRFDLGKQSEQGDHHLGPQVLLAGELDPLLDGDEANLAPDQGFHDLDHLREAAAEPRQLADQQPVAGLERPQHFVDAALERTLARRDPGLDELVDREAAFLAELEDRQLLVGEILRTSEDTEVGDGFQGASKKRSNGVYLGVLKIMVSRTLYSQLTSSKTDIIIDTWP